MGYEDNFLLIIALDGVQLFPNGMQPVQGINGVIGDREGRRADAEELGKLGVLWGWWWWWWSIVLRRILDVVEESSHHVGLLGEDLSEDGVGVWWWWWWRGRR